MGDLKTFYEDPVYPNTTDLSGDLPTARGGDPNVDAAGSSALKTFFDEAVVPTPGNSETSNSTSGLPLQPARFQPSETPPEPPALEDRNPGTIDKR